MKTQSELRTTHGKNGVAELPAVRESGEGGSDLREVVCAALDVLVGSELDAAATRATSREEGTVRPIFVVLEGVRGVGKKSLALELAQRFVESEEDVAVVHTPSYDRQYGRIALDLQRRGPSPGADHRVFALTLQCLLDRDRYEVSGQIASRLASGSSVICTRWWTSSVVNLTLDELVEGRVSDPTEIVPPHPDLYLLVERDSVGAESEPREDSSLYDALWSVQSKTAAGSWASVRGSGPELVQAAWDHVVRARRER